MTLFSRASRLFAAGLVVTGIAIAPLTATAQEVIYDTITGLTFGDTDPATTNRQLEADIITPIAPPAGMVWQVTLFEAVLGINGAQDQDVALFFGIWNTVDTTLAPPAGIFSNPAPIGGQLPAAGLNIGLGFRFGQITTTGTGISRGVASITLDATDNVLLGPGPIGVTTHWGVRPVGSTGTFDLANRNFGTSLALANPVVGTSPNGFLRDVNFDLLFQNSEVRLVQNQTANLAIRITAVAVPDPAAAVPGDTDMSGCVDDADLTNIILDFGGAGGSTSGFAGTDINGDGIVDDADLTDLILNFGTGC